MRSGFARSLGALVVAVALSHCRNAPAGTPVASAPSSQVAVQQSSTETFAGYAADATRVLETSLFSTPGYWRLCLSGCAAVNYDWGADSLTYTVYLRWLANHDPALKSILQSLVTTTSTWPACTTTPSSCQWSDVPEWDSIADSREFVATGDSHALSKAQAAYNYVAQSKMFALGKCPEIRYQLPQGGGGGLKTLETEANDVKAALLLFGETKQQQYLNEAIFRYGAIRRHFLDPAMPLYTVYVFDDGSTCSQVPHRFFGSVNGDMIFNSLYLGLITKNTAYLNDASATVHAVVTKLSDSRGVYADLQAENDIGEPLVEAMYEMALHGNTEARTWLLANARAALFQDRSSNGLYGRFFDGPTPTWNVTAWQTNGGLALAMVAGQMQPAQTASASVWSNAKFIADTINTLPSTVITFHGSGIAVIGAIGDRCCQPGHAQVLLDGTQTVDETGIWQNKSSSGLRIPNAVLFAWRWPASGTHTIQFLPGIYNAKEGGPYLNATGYYVLP